MVFEIQNHSGPAFPQQAVPGTGCYRGQPGPPAEAKSCDRAGRPGLRLLEE